MRRSEKKLNMVKANLLAESRYLGAKGVINEGIQKTDYDIDDMAKAIIKDTKDEAEENALIVKSAQGDEDIQRRLTDRVSRLKINEVEEVSSDDYFSKYNTTMQEQKEICWNMIKHFKSIDKAIAENEKMMNDKIDRAKAAEAAGDIEEANDYMESIKLFQFRIQYMNNNRDMLSLSKNPFFNK